MLREGGCRWRWQTPAAKRTYSMLRLRVDQMSRPGDDSALAAVEKVTFVLHEATFHKPIVVRRAPALRTMSRSIP